MKYSLIYSIVLFFTLSFTAYSNDRENISLDDGIVTFKGGNCRACLYSIF